MRVKWEVYGRARQIRLSQNSCRSPKRTQVVYLRLPGTSVVGFYIPPLRGWNNVVCRTVLVRQGVIPMARVFTSGTRDLPPHGLVYGRSLAAPEERLRSG